MEAKLPNGGAHRIPRCLGKTWKCLSSMCAGQPGQPVIAFQQKPWSKGASPVIEQISSQPTRLVKVSHNPFVPLVRARNWPPIATYSPTSSLESCRRAR